MKRSEMISLLIDAVYEHCYDGIELVPDEASAILKDLEDAGMLMCEKKDLGSIGKLWTPVGWEFENEEENEDE